MALIELDGQMPRQGYISNMSEETRDEATEKEFVVHMNRKIVIGQER